MIASATPHVPVMAREAVEALAPREGGIYVDGTFGRGGYSRAILESARTARVIGIDRDPEAVEAAAVLIAAFAPRLTVVQGLFGAMGELLSRVGVAAVDGIALDLGVSSPQLDDAARGFSFQKDGALDMRMSRQGPSAADWVNGAEEEELANILYRYGDERFSRRIARRIVEKRRSAPLTRTRELAELVRAVVPRAQDGLDPATRTFQALRIAVNDELGELDRGLNAAERLLKPEGRLVIVSFHSLEDRAVKLFLRERAGRGPRESRHAALPVPQKSQDGTFRLVTSKPLFPGSVEKAANPRARSARLRIAIRTNASPFMETAA